MKITFAINELDGYYKYEVLVMSSQGRQLHRYKVSSYSDVRSIVQAMKDRYKDHLEIVREMD